MILINKNKNKESILFTAESQVPPSQKTFGLERQGESFSIPNI